MIALSALSRNHEQMLGSSSFLQPKSQDAVLLGNTGNDVALGFAEGRNVAQGRPVGGQEVDDRARRKALQALAQAQNRQRAVEPPRVYDNGRLVLRHGLRKIL